MASIPIPTSRVSNSLITTRLLTQLQFDQTALLKSQDQLSTGRRISAPSEDAPAALRAMGLQRLLERKDQVEVNLNTSNSYLAATDSSLSGVADILHGIRGDAVAAADSTTSESERQALSQRLSRNLQQLVDIGNQSFRGRFLFGGSISDEPPFQLQDGKVIFSGGETEFRSFIDIDLLARTNYSGPEVFGAISTEVLGKTDFNPVLNESTRLTNLRGGLGIGDGSLQISDGTTSSTIDISSAETLGDIVRLIEANPPTGRTLTVRITENALTVDIDDTGGGNLTIQEVAGGTTAAALGIVNETGTATNPINGTDLDPIVTKTTLLDDILGVRASALVTSTGNDDDIIVEAVQNGTALNGTVVQFVDDNVLRAAGGLSVGNETVSYSTTAVAASAALTLSGVNNDLVFTARTAGTAANNINIVLDATNNIGDAAVVTFDGTSTVTIQIDDTNETTLQTLVDAVNNQVGGLFNVAADNSAGEAFDGASLVSSANAGFASGNTSNSGAAAGTLLINIDVGDTTADDIVAAINSDVTVSQLFEARVDGKDTVLPVREGTGDISVNATATIAGGSGEQFDRQSGIQIINDGTMHNISFTTAVTVEDMLNILNGSDAGVLAEINSDGTGINVRTRLSGADFHIGENGGATATQLGLRSFDQDTILSNLNHGVGIHTTEGTDFTIRRNDGVELEIDLSTAQTVGDVLDLINNDPDNLDPSTALVARLKATGNGIELVDDNPLGVGTLTLIADPLSKAAQDIGLLPQGLQQTSPSDSAPPVAATATAAFPAPDDVNTGILFTAAQAGTTFNGVNVIITSGTATGDQALVTYDPNAKTLSIDVDPLATTAQTVVNAVTVEGTFSAALDLSTDLTNNGTGLINQIGSAAISAGGTSNPASLPASATVQLAPPNQTNTSMLVTALGPGTGLNGVDIVFQDTQTGDVAVALYNGVTKQLVVNIDTAATTANTVIQAIISEGTFNASLDNSVDVTNNGSGIIAVAGTAGTTLGGTPEILVGNDVNPLEVSGIFNSITRLNDALGVNDLVQIQRAVELLDEDLDRLGFARGELGAQQRAMDILEFRLEEENIQLQSSLSLEIDIDLAEAITEMTARQTTLEASMRSMGVSFQLTLLDFL